MIGSAQRVSLSLATVSVFAGVCLGAPAAPQGSCDLLGEVFSASPFGTTIQLKGDSAEDIQKVPFSAATDFQRVNVDRSPAGNFDPKGLQTGDLICVQLSAVKAVQDQSPNVAARIFVMRREDIQEQQKRVLSAVARNTAFGTVTRLDAASHAIGIDETEDGAQGAVTVDVSGPVTFRQFAPGAQTSIEVSASDWDHLKIGDQIFVEGDRTNSRSRIRAGIIILGGVRAVDGTIVELSGLGLIDLQDLRSGRQMTIQVPTDSVFRISPFLEEGRGGQPASATSAWDLHHLGFADLQKGDTVSILVKASDIRAGQNQAQHLDKPGGTTAETAAEKMTQKAVGKTLPAVKGLMVTTGFGSFGTDRPPVPGPAIWLLDPLRRTP